MTETHRIIDLANKVVNTSGGEIEFIENPRNEDNENELHVSNETFIKLGLTPTTLDSNLMDEVTEIAKKYIHRCDINKIPCKSHWRKNKIMKSSLRIEGEESHSNTPIT